jgi:carboxylesterase type B
MLTPSARSTCSVRETSAPTRTFSRGPDSPPIRRRCSRRYGDWLFRTRSARLAAARSAEGQPTYLFELAYTVLRMAGAPHGADNPLIFGNFAGGTADRFYVDPAAPETEQLGSRMRKAWARFAHAGNPGWEPFTAKSCRRWCSTSNRCSSAIPTHAPSKHTIARK